MGVKCPTCGEDKFETERSMKIHHSISHNESIALQSTECELCSKNFKFYPSEKEGKFCKDCVKERSDKGYIEGKSLLKECRFCPKEFRTKKSADKDFCTRDCYIKSQATEEISCVSCGKTTNKSPKGLCKHCLQEKQRKERKKKLINKRGGGCELCGYNAYLGSLSFHHKEDENKEFNLGGNNIMRSLSVVLKEFEKCVVLCRNCHLEEHCSGTEFCTHN